MRHMSDLADIDIGSEAPALEDFDPNQVATAALQVFFNIATRWGLSREEEVALLGRPSQRTVYRWRKGDVSALPHDTLERISVIFGIYKAIRILLPQEDRADAWMRSPNAAFGGSTALDVMLRGRVDHLYEVRRYLDAERG